MGYRKKLYESPLFGEPVWIVNLTPEQAMADAEVAESNFPIFSESELAVMRLVPEEGRQEHYKMLLQMKKVFRTAEITYYGEERSRGEVVYAPEKDLLPIEEPAKTPRNQRTSLVPHGRVSVDPNVQKRLI